MSRDLLEEIPVENIVQLCARSFATIDGAWFVAVEEKYGLEAAMEMDLRAWQIYAGRHARRVLRTFDLTGDDIGTLLRAIKADPFNSILKPEGGPVTERKGVIRFTDCAPQTARVRTGRGEFPCKAIGEVWMSEYAKSVNPDIKMRCVVCPPDPHPDDFWCEWEFEI